MNQLPFNACDYRCEHCLATEECAVFQRLRECSLQESANGGNDLGAVLNDIRESFRETEAKIKQRAREVGIDIDEITGGYSQRKVREQHQGAVADPLYKQAYEFTLRAQQFLQEEGLSVPDEARTYIDDIAWHHVVVTAKVYRTVVWKTDEEGAVDAVNSAAVALKSLTICIMAFEYLADHYPDLAKESRRLLNDARKIKEGIKARIKPARAA